MKYKTLWQYPIDLMINRPGYKEYANCVKTKDRSISKHYKEENGVIVKVVKYEQDKQSDSNR